MTPADRCRAAIAKALRRRALARRYPRRPKRLPRDRLPDDRWLVELVRDE